MLHATAILEKRLWGQGKFLICGIDEVGRGCFAGPLVVGAVIFSPKSQIPDGIADSKLLSPAKRERLASAIKKSAVCWSISQVSVKVINKVGIAKATQIAFRQVVAGLSSQPDHILIDAFYIKHFNRKLQSAIKKGDRDCVSIAAASIIAKVYRDSLMSSLHQTFPQYGFSKHKGYGTKEHQLAIKKFGFCPLHRTSFNLQKFL